MNCWPSFNSTNRWAVAGKSSTSALPINRIARRTVVDRTNGEEPTESRVLAAIAYLHCDPGGQSNSGRAQWIAASARSTRPDERGARIDLDASISGDVKGTITDAVRYRFVSNDIRRHRVISISYTSLLPCHRLPAQTKSAVRCFGVALLGPLDHFLDGIGRMMIHRLRKLAVRITIRDQGCDVISPSQMSLR